MKTTMKRFSSIVLPVSTPIETMHAIAIIGVTVALLMISGCVHNRRTLLNSYKSNYTQWQSAGSNEAVIDPNTISFLKASASIIEGRLVVEGRISTPSYKLHETMKRNYYLNEDYQETQFNIRRRCVETKTVNRTLTDIPKGSRIQVYHHSCGKAYLQIDDSGGFRGPIAFDFRKVSEPTTGKPPPGLRLSYVPPSGFRFHKRRYPVKVGWRWEHGGFGDRKSRMVDVYEEKEETIKPKSVIVALPIRGDR